jgi:hypothetical protein
MWWDEDYPALADFKEISPFLATLRRRTTNSWTLSLNAPRIVANSIFIFYFLFSIVVSPAIGLCSRPSLSSSIIPSPLNMNLPEGMLSNFPMTKPGSNFERTQGVENKLSFELAPLTSSALARTPLEQAPT